MSQRRKFNDRNKVRAQVHNLGIRNALRRAPVVRAFPLPIPASSGTKPSPDKK